MEVGGVDLASLDLDNSDFVLPEVVPGRILNEDGDIIAYNCAGNDETSREEVVFNLKAEIKNRMALAGADRYICHITGDGSDKGKRHDFACVKQYQVSRIGKPKPANLAFARQFIQSSMNSMVHSDQEADDGLAQFQQGFIDSGTPELCVLDSTDKDLRMVQGLHIDPDTGSIVNVDGFGSCYYDNDKKKTTGWGYSFFWHQLLMGDVADDIPGLPAFGKDLSRELWPTTAYTETTRRLKELTMPSGKNLSEKQYKAAQAKIVKVMAEYKNKPAGAKFTQVYLKGCNNNSDALKLVVAAYESYYGTDEFVFEDWRGNSMKRTAFKMLIEQAVLLWMRRTRSELDVANFLQEVRNGSI